MPEPYQKLKKILTTTSPPSPKQIIRGAKKSVSYLGDMLKRARGAGDRAEEIMTYKGRKRKLLKYNKGPGRPSRPIE